MPDTRPQWLIDLWAAIEGPPPPPPFAPTFEEQHYVVGLGGVVALNIQYFATKECANTLMAKLTADHVALVDYQGSGGTEHSDAKERWLVWADGTAVNAGILAGFYVRNPENLYPHLAENQCLRAVQLARAAGQKLPVTGPQGTGAL